MLLVAGLGNPGQGYARNRHNIGFMAVDAIAHRHGVGPFRSKFDGDLAQGDIAGERVVLLKPMTYMNESGRSVGAAMRFFKLAPKDIVVFHDELDLAPGKIRTKTGGGHAGHNGLRSIQAHIGADFRRVRLGIGHPGDKERVLGHVLEDFAKADEDWLGKMMEGIAEYLPLLIDGKDESFMSKVAQTFSPPRNQNPRKAGENENG